MDTMDFSELYDELLKLNGENFNSGNLDAILANYDEHAVIVDKTGGKVGYGHEQIRTMLEAELGQMDFKQPLKEVIPLAGDRFYTNCQYENTVLSTGKVLRGSYQEIWAMRGDRWKVIFVTVERA